MRSEDDFQEMKMKSSVQESTEFSISSITKEIKSVRIQENNVVFKEVFQPKKVQVAPLPEKNVAPQKEKEAAATNKGLRPIVIDGPNVAMLHGLQSTFSVRGIELVIEYFVERNHNHVVAFLPKYRKQEGWNLLTRLERDGHVVFTPSRKAGSINICSYDDRMMLDYAAEVGAVVVSNDNFRDLYEEDVIYKETIEKRILQPMFIGDNLRFPKDPLGRNGPRLEEFLKY